jgi:pentatricopeptide repeat protein
MQCDGYSPDTVTFICILKACGKARAIDQGKQIHDQISNRGLLENDIVVGNALVDMYAKCGALDIAQGVLNTLPVQDAVSWNALISGYEHQGKANEALKYYDQMRREGLSPNAVTFICVLKACGNLKAIEKGKQIHEEILKSGLLEKDVALGSALVDMYAKCGMVMKAQQVLEKLPIRNAISWCALIAGYARQRQQHEALNGFEQMQSEGLSPDVVTFACILKACSNAGSVSKGTQIHEDIMSRNLLQKDIVLGNALLDMYAKCGVPENAQKLLEELTDRDAVSWNALIGGYARQGKGHEALNCFNQMLSEGIWPSEITFSCILNACSHSGLLDEAQDIFGSMTRKYCISPNLEHNMCMVVVFGCAGHFDRAMTMIKAMPSAEYVAVWVALLGACEKWVNLKLGKLAFDQVLQLDNTCVEAYVLMATLFSASGMQEDADNVEAMRVKYATMKE